MSYYIKVPEPITQKNLATGEPVNERPLAFRTFVVGTLLMDKRFSANFKALRSASAIADEAEKTVTPGQYLVLTDNDFDLLKSVAEEPQGLRQDGAAGYPSGGFVQIVPFLRAIVNATSDKPAELEEKKE